MKQRMIVIGQSAFSALLAHDLDNQLGSLVQTELVWLTPSPRVCHLATLPSLLTGHLPTLAAPLSATKTDRAPIRSVNLRDRRVVTEAATWDYDFLLIDQTPSYSRPELELIGQQLRTLLAGLSAAQKTGAPKSARVYCRGALPEAWQLALLISSDVERLYPRLLGAVEIFIDMPAGATGQFLKNQRLKAVTPKGLERPGLTIQAPSSALPSRRIRGITVDRAGYVMTDHTGAVTGQSNVIIIDGPTVGQVNVLRVWRTQARRLAAAIANQLEGSGPLTLAWPTPAFVLRGTLGHYAALGQFSGWQLPGGLIHRLDRHVSRQLSA